MLAELRDDNTRLTSWRPSHCRSTPIRFFDITMLISRTCELQRCAPQGTRTARVASVFSRFTEAHGSRRRALRL
jgi:hypothetical protein